MLGGLRRMSIHLHDAGNLETIEWDRLSEGIKTALRNTHFTSPHLSSLVLDAISISSYDLVGTWKSIKEISLVFVEMNTVKETSKNVSILEQQLERLLVSGRKFPLPLALQNRQMLGGLQKFFLHFQGACHSSVQQTWNVIHIASSSLVALFLGSCFVTSLQPHFLTMENFPSLRHLRIFDSVMSTETFLETVYPFFKLANPMSTSKLEGLHLALTWEMPIGSSSSYGDEVLLPNNGWRQLDSLLTSSHYPHLRHVTISICLSDLWDLSSKDPARVSRIWDIFDRVQSSLFPLLSCLDFIEFFCVPRAGSD
ncbi:hypothetical protein M413DRAFT_287351 [Hebeloma cylindrosporum]|uniref:Uncharacterized protein n=1 Tax=Hebeloma cylindrosporum TaxID=76867 RepID=A0A0C2XFK4_HEBCY|nr:hypothetical protein M413DRAFT_287351 [Hebeloma cylindrosporum h7]